MLYEERFLRSIKGHEQSVYMPMNELFPMVDVYDEDFYHRLGSDIHAHGMMFPIIAVEITEDAWKYMHEAQPDAILPPPWDAFERSKPVYQVRCGNNRVRIAEELGYSHISAVLFTANPITGACPEASVLCSHWRRDVP